LFYGGLGFSWRFDDYYEPVIIPLENEKEKEIREKIEDKKGKVEEIGGAPVVPVEGNQDVDPENIKEEMQVDESTDDNDEEGGRRKRKSRKKDKENNTEKTEQPKRKETAPPKEVPTVIDLKNVKRE
jgi:hypothetical protein